MTKVRGGPRSHQKHKKILKAAEGYRMTRSTLYKRAADAVLRAGEHAFAGRKKRRRDLRRLWIIRLNAALGKHDISYSHFIKGLKEAKVGLNRKSLSEMAISDPESFDEVVSRVKKSFNE